MKPRCMATLYKVLEQPNLVCSEKEGRAVGAYAGVGAGPTVRDLVKEASG